MITHLKYWTGSLQLNFNDLAGTSAFKVTGPEVRVGGVLIAIWFFKFRTRLFMVSLWARFDEEKLKVKPAVTLVLWNVWRTFLVSKLHFLIPLIPFQLLHRLTWTTPCHEVLEKTLRGWLYACGSLHLSPFRQMLFWKIINRWKG